MEQKFNTFFLETETPEKIRSTLGEFIQVRDRLEARGLRGSTVRSESDMDYVLELPYDSAEVLDNFLSRYGEL